MAVPMVSVVIPTHNYAGFVREAIDSVLAQTYRDVEVVVVDDGSTDDTAAVLDAYGARIRRIHQEQRGLPAARNAGIRASRGRLVGFLDSDDLWCAEKLGHQVPVLESTPSAGMVYCDTELFEDAAGTSLGRHGATVPHVSGQVLPALVLGNFILSPTPLVRREVLERVGLFDERLKSSEDWDLWLRIACGHEIAYVDRVLTRYRFHGRNMHKNQGRMLDSQLQVLEKLFARADLPACVSGLRGLAFGQVHVHFGVNYFWNDQFAEARRELGRALRSNPRLLRDRDILEKYVGCLLGGSFVRRARAWKRWWQ
ncbi:MAG TPA: glycosyltransferase [Candidatus Methylomirabilis sp.]|nr:glycosyltransferase [Candidatus Methylomirabilis sp.]